MKRSWLLLLLLAGSLAALNAPAFAQDADSVTASAQDTLEDVNAALGNLTNRITTLENAKPSVQVHGFAEFDSIYDTTQGFTEVVGDGAVTKAGTAAADNGELEFSPRNSRISILGTDNVGGWDTKGYLETDFYGYDPVDYGSASVTTTTTTTNVVTNGGVGGVTVTSTSTSKTTLYNAVSGNTEYKLYSQPTLRIRHAYAEASNDGWDFLVGQYWTLFGGTGDYILATVDVQPIMGTIYERQLQARASKTFSIDDFKIMISADAERPEQIDSDVPNLVAGLRLTLDSWKTGFTYATGGTKVVPFSINLSVRDSNSVWINPEITQQYNNIWGQAVALDTIIPIIPANDLKDFSAVLTGEWTSGSGDTDPFNGGFTGGLTALSNAINSLEVNQDPGVAGFTNTGNYTLVQFDSWNGQLQFHLPNTIGTLFTLGYGEVFSPNVGGLYSSFATSKGTTTYSGQGSYNDDSNYFFNVMQDVTKEIRVGLEYAVFDTHYANIAKGTEDSLDHRIQLSTWYRF